MLLREIWAKWTVARVTVVDCADTLATATGAADAVTPARTRCAWLVIGAPWPGSVLPSRLPTPSAAAVGVRPGPGGPTGRTITSVGSWTTLRAAVVVGRQSVGSGRTGHGLRLHPAARPGAVHAPARTPAAPAGRRWGRVLGMIGVALKQRPAAPRAPAQGTVRRLARLIARRSARYGARADGPGHGAATVLTARAWRSVVRRASPARYH